MIIIFPLNRSMRAALFTCLLLSISPCSTMHSGRGQGEDVSLASWHRIKLAAKKAVIDLEAMKTHQTGYLKKSLNLQLDWRF